MSNVANEALAYLSGSSPLDQVERAMAAEMKKLEPGPLATLDIEDLTAVAHLLELRIMFPGVERRQLVLLGARSRHSPLDEALAQLSESHVAALGQAGLGMRVIDLLKSWMTATIATVQARNIERLLEVARIVDTEVRDAPVDVPAFADPAAPLSAAELGQRMGVGDESVRQRERAGKLFSILRPGRKRGREYPAFQGWPEIAGEPIERALAALGPRDGTEAYGFFTSKTDLLAGLTPIEVLLGKPLSARKLDTDAAGLLSLSKEERLTAVEKAATAEAAQLSA